MRIVINRKYVKKEGVGINFIILNLKEKTNKSNNPCNQALNAGLLLWYITLSLHFTTKASLRWGLVHGALDYCNIKVIMFSHLVAFKRIVKKQRVASAQ